MKEDKTKPRIGDEVIFVCELEEVKNVRSGFIIIFDGMEYIVLEIWYDRDWENEEENPGWRVRTRILKRLPVHLPDEA